MFVLCLKLYLPEFLKWKIPNVCWQHMVLGVVKHDHFREIGRMSGTYWPATPPWRAYISCLFGYRFFDSNADFVLSILSAVKYCTAPSSLGCCCSQRAITCFWSFDFIPMDIRPLEACDCPFCPQADKQKLKVQSKRKGNMLDLIFFLRR